MRASICVVLLALTTACGGSDSDGSDGTGGAGGSSGAGAGGSSGSAGSGGSSSGGSAGAGSGGTAGSATGGAAGAAGGSGSGGSGGSSGAGPDYPGQASEGMLVWGAAIGGNGDPVVRHETPANHPLTLRRTFWQWDQRTGKAIEIAKDDIAHQRLPWVSFKTPSWAEMGQGQHDAAIDEMLNALDAVAGPVWLTIHHEPEGGGGVNSPDDPAGPSGHVAMNQRVRERMTALGVDNIALAPVLMSYTWDPASGRDPNAWWKEGIYDFLGVDHYRDAEATLLNDTWAKVRVWAEQKNVEVSVGEWGMRGTDAAAGQRLHDWYDAAAGSHADGAGARVVGLAAFDSSLNSPNGSWELKGEQLTAFWELLADPRTAIVTP
jgi:hypothetical protein